MATIWQLPFSYNLKKLDTLFSSPFTYGIKLQQHNATGGNQAQAYNWNALYGGLFVNTNILKINDRININGL